jgi:host factor-I protein
MRGCYTGMSEKIINVQDAFLNYMRKNKIPVTIFLLNGVKITGTISCFDHGSVVVRREGYTQLIYKHAISTFSPHGTISVFDWNGSQGSDYQRRNVDDRFNQNLKEVAYEGDDDENFNGDDEGDYYDDEDEDEDDEDDGEGDDMEDEV